MKKLILLIIGITLLSCGNQEKYVSPKEPIQKYCWFADLDCSGTKKTVAECFYSANEIKAVIQNKYPLCTINRIYQ